MLNNILFTIVCAAFMAGALLYGIDKEAERLEKISCMYSNGDICASSRAELEYRTNVLNSSIHVGGYRHDEIQPLQNMQ